MSKLLKAQVDKKNDYIGPYSWKRDNFNPPLFQE